MKTLRQLCAALVLTLAFALSTYADDGHASCPVITAPPPESGIECGVTVESLLASLLSLV